MSTIFYSFLTNFFGVEPKMDKTYLDRLHFSENSNEQDLTFPMNSYIILLLYMTS
jgi:hypothetical protein